MPPHGGHHGGHHGGGFRGAWGYPGYSELVVVNADPVCPQIWAPVRGTDGHMYPNSCFAQAAGAWTTPSDLGVTWGDIAAWFTGSPVSLWTAANCEDKSAEKMKAFDARIQEIKWFYYPPETFTWAQVNTVIGQLLVISKVATDAIEKGNLEYSRQALIDAQTRIFNTIGAKANELLAARQPVSGLDMKNWVIDSLLAVQAGMEAMVSSFCSRPWWFNALAAFQSAFDKVWNVLAAIGRGIKAVADNWKYVKWGAAAFIAYVVYNEYGGKLGLKKSRRARR